MKDRELLELAAKAAGFQIGNEVGEYGWWNCEAGWLFACRNANGTLTPWNPLTNDGDALWLATKLRISIAFSGRRYGVAARPIFDICCEHESADETADIRSAIVRAAAGIKTHTVELTGSGQVHRPESSDRRERG